MTHAEMEAKKNARRAEIEQQIDKLEWRLGEIADADGSCLPLSITNFDYWCTERDIEALRKELRFL